MNVCLSRVLGETCPCSWSACGHAGEPCEIDGECPACCPRPRGLCPTRRTTLPYAPSGGDAWKAMTQEPFWYVRTATREIAHAAESVRRFVDGWFDLVLQH